MKQFIRQFLVFSGFAIIALSICLLGIYNYGKHLNWRLKDAQTILFIGDSHIEQGINDQEIDKIFTFAQSGDCYLYTFFKLKKILADNPQIRQVFLGIDYHNVDLTADDW